MLTKQLKCDIIYNREREKNPHSKYIKREVAKMLTNGKIYENYNEETHDLDKLLELVEHLFDNIDKKVPHLSRCNFCPFYSECVKKPDYADLDCEDTILKFLEKDKTK